MAGLVEEIQTAALDPQVRVTDLLRKVKLAAVKLQLTDTIEWVDRELKGYDNLEEAPPYRRTVGQLKGHTPLHGVVPVTGDTDWLEDICRVPIGDPISKVEVLAGDGSNEVIGRVNGALTEALNKANGTRGTEFYVHTPQNVMLDIIEQVRNLVLEWSIGLEKAGIMGEGISFSPEEKRKAQAAIPSIAIGTFSGHLHQGDVTGHQNRVNLHAEDNSFNTIEIESTFQALRQAIADRVDDPDDKKVLLGIVQQMQANTGRASFAAHYQQLVAHAADYMTILTPFLPALSSLLGR